MNLSRSIILLCAESFKNSPRVGFCTLDTACTDMPRHSETEVKPILYFDHMPLKDQAKGWEIYLSIQNTIAELSFRSSQESAFKPSPVRHFILSFDP